MPSTYFNEDSTPSRERVCVFILFSDAFLKTHGQTIFVKSSHILNILEENPISESFYNGNIHPLIHLFINLCGYKY